MIKVSDYVLNYITSLGVKHVFMLAGGQAMHLNDSTGKNRRLKFVCALHEQAAAMMAEAYSRTTDNYGVCIVTTGPGGTNAVTGVMSAWLDSTPCMFLSGQFRVDCTVGKQKIRQTCLQSTDPATLMKPITKYAVMVTDPSMIRYHLEKAFYLSTSGRPGPVWLDLPLDVQSAIVDDKKLVGFKPVSENNDRNNLSVKAGKVLKILSNAKRPVILAGNGIRLAHSIPDFLKLVDKLKIPVLTSINGIDLIQEKHPMYFGRPNYWGQRYANFTIQNADVLITLGAGLHLETTSFNYKSFAREAYRIVVDIDRNELKKKYVKPNMPICADVGLFIKCMLTQAKYFSNDNLKSWRDVCRSWKARYPVIVPNFYQNTNLVNPFIFTDTLCDEISSDDAVIPGSAGTHFTTAVQAFKVKKGQRVFSEIGIGAMGHSLPSSIAASVARGNKRVICLTGDGGIQLNIQELQTVMTYKLPIKIFVMNNNGYMSIRNTQRVNFNSNFVGCNKVSGLQFPSFKKIAGAYGLKYAVMRNNKEIKTVINKVLSTNGPVLCEVMLDPEAVLMPRVTSRRLPDGRMVSSPLEDQWPFLDRNALKKEMFIELCKG